MTVADLREVQRIVSEGRWRENVQAKDWVGKAVAQAIRLDVEEKSHRSKISALLRKWIAEGMLVVVDGADDRRQIRAYVEVGELATD